MRLGFHVSVAKGPRGIVELAGERGCDAVQIFSSNPRSWALSSGGPDADRELRRGLEARDIHPVLLHTPYLVNIAARDPDVYARSVASLVHAADRARRLAGLVVVHAGRDGAGPRAEAVTRAAAALLAALKLVPGARLLVEPTAGGRGSVASTLPETAELLDAVDDDRVGVCPDTCHAHACGYDMARRARAWIDEVDRLVGVERVAAMHCNDSRDPCGSCRDRHWHLGRGEIGERGFRTLLSDPRLRDTAVIMETPGRLPEDLENMARARTWVGGTTGARRPGVDKRR